MNQLNPQQHKAVHYIDGPLLVLAGAGSGKTSVITRKIAYLIEQCNYSARHIAAVTFTNKAAREMKERVGKLVQGKASHGLTVSTFHNLGLNIIRREIRTLGFKNGFSILDQEDTKALLKDLMLRESQLDGDHVDLVQHQISDWKNNLLCPQMAMSKAQSSGEQTLAMLYQRYTQALRAYNSVDFDDLILIPAQLFRDHPDILQKWQRQIRYLLVDEYQDTNMAQYELVQQLVGDRGGLTVVGDDDQSIYAWRGARPENLVKLGEDYPTLKLIKLEQNYRSTARILKAANCLIANNPHVYEKTLWSELGFGEPMRLIRCGNEETECERVANEILSQRIHRKCHFKDFAVLYRGNFQSRILELKLQAAGIPYHLSGGTSFFARTEIKDIMAYLRLLVNPDDDNAFLRIINTPRRQIGASTLEKLGEYANERHISMHDAIDELGLKERLPAQSLERLQRFKHWLDSVQRNAESNDPVAAVKEMIDDIDYEGWLHHNTSNAKVAENRYKNVLFLVEQLANAVEREEESANPLESAISKLILRDMLDRQEEEDADDKVQLMTMHASKGLEFPHVFVIGMEEDLLPHRTSIDEDNIEEERRLAYVAITRARQTLTMTLAGKRKQYGEIIETTPSRFLDELPQADIEREGFGDNDPDRNREKGKKSLDDLKALFG
ncbi:DNA helicase Rep [Porticoccus sp. W117]|uniref:DNA helicase Rep n=1 Tax=Porticoccus sp. W117 TaxID=3054777 RepID=UPI00259A29D5|nr:DNA helicase Rep [Porticoccus sp. W117]MDM3872186.1 DNA helicase Rep [Porticoccus sp. W117]